MKKEKKAFFKGLADGSFICSGLDRLAAIFYRKAEDGVVGGIMTGDGKVNEKLHSGFFGSLLARLNRSKKLKHGIAKSCEESRILGFISDVINGLGCTATRVYGMFFVVFALVSGGISYLRAPVGATLSDLRTPIVVTVAMLLGGILMLFSGRSIMQKFTGSSMISFLLFSVLGVRRKVADFPTKGTGKMPIGAILGVMAGLFTFAVPAQYLVLGCVLLLGLYTVLLIPECGVMLSVFGLCFLPTMMMVALVAYTFICYMLKLGRGKRTFRFNAMDAGVTAFFIFMICGGISSVGGTSSLPPAMVYLCFMLGYFLMVNLIRSDAWVKRTVYSMSLGALLVAAYGVYQNYFAPPDTTWQDTDMFGDASGRVVSTFENPNVLGEYLIMVIPLIFALMIVSKSYAGKGAALVTLGLCLGCMIFTMSRGAWLGIMFAMLIFMLVYTRKTMALCIGALFLIPFLPMVVPEEILYRFTSIGNLSDSSTSYRVSIWTGAMKMIEAFPLTGIGIGNGAFARVYPMYSLSGIEEAPHAHNLMLQTAIEIGIPGLLVLLAVFFLFAQSSFGFFRRCDSASGKRGKLISLALFAGVMGVVLQGMTDYIWYNYRVYLMFWLVIGLAEAVKRVSSETDMKEEID